MRIVLGALESSSTKQFDVIAKRIVELTLSFFFASYRCDISVETDIGMIQYVLRVRKPLPCCLSRTEDKKVTMYKCRDYGGSL